MPVRALARGAVSGPGIASFVCIESQPTLCLFRGQRLEWGGRTVEDPRPNRLATSSTSTRAERPRSSWNGFSSPRREERTRAQSWSISMMRCASRKVAPPGTAVPTAGATEGQR